MLSHTSISYGGKYKNIQNYISATNENGESYTLFTPLSPFETPNAMEELCEIKKEGVDKSTYYIRLK